MIEFQFFLELYAQLSRACLLCLILDFDMFDVDNLDFIHLDSHHLETLVHKLPNSQ